MVDRREVAAVTTASNSQSTSNYSAAPMIPAYTWQARDGRVSDTEHLYDIRLAFGVVF
jgi:hypothetical protein